ncbi:MAG: hypothetical protein SWX82_26840 [Cyanobacteriota bacterium]|nr:hypothetical protein [Cyanobacteriota bacterium]
MPGSITLGYNYKIVNLLFLKQEARRKKEEGKLPGSITLGYN